MMSSSLDTRNLSTFETHIEIKHFEQTLISSRFREVIMAINALLEIKIRKALDLLPLAHCLPPSTDETVIGLDEGKLRLQDYAFSQDFCLIVESYDKKRQRMIMKCSRHKKKTRNTRKLKEETRARAAINVAFNECPYRVKMTHIKNEE